MWPKSSSAQYEEVQCSPCDFCESSRNWGFIITSGLEFLLLLISLSHTVFHFFLLSFLFDTKAVGRLFLSLVFSLNCAYKQCIAKTTLYLQFGNKQILHCCKMSKFSSGWCGSVDWVQACDLKGHQFDSQWGHVPGLWVRSPVGGAWEATTHWCFSSSLSSSLPFSLKINK